MPTADDPNRSTPRQSRASASVALDLPVARIDRLRRLGTKLGGDLQPVFLAAFAVLLHRQHSEAELLIDLRYSQGRVKRLAQTSRSPGDIVPLRLDLADTPTTDAFLQRVEAALNDALAPSGVSSTRIVEAMQPRHYPGLAPRCQVVFDYRKPPDEAPGAGDCGIFPNELCLRIDATGDAVDARLIYDAALFDGSTIRRMAGHLLTLLDDLASETSGATPISALRLLTDAEWQHIVVELNATAGDYPAASTLSALFAAQAARTPNAVAVIDPATATTLSYRQLEERASQLANHLVGLGVGHETLVGVSLARSPELFVTVIAILKAGACYVPLDPGYPAQRLAAMIEDSGSSLIVTGTRWRELLAPHGSRLLCIDDDWPLIAAESASSPPCPATADSLAYVVFTSGSTGRPKGVLVEQRQLLNRFAWMWREYPFAAGDVSACKTALNFVDSLWELLGPLLQGIPSVVVAQRTLLDPEALIELLAQYRVSRMMLVPSLLRMLLDADAALAQRIPRLREWCIGGEPLSIELARHFARALPGRLLLNLYGLSETFDACFFDAGKLTEEDTLVPIGRPLANVQAYVLDALRHPLPFGVVGELYVGGAGLARGYLGQPELSAARFIANPFSDRPGDRIYRTGDLARLRPDGIIDYLGRSDHQVKIRGFRVEVDEVGSVLARHPQVAHAVVVARSDAGGAASETSEMALAAYFVARDDAPPTAASVHDWLRQRLPDYMLPASYTLLARLPLTPSGKVDRLSLPAPDKRQAHSDSPYAAPAGETEQIIAAIWQEVLHVDRVGSDDNFFDLGGTSLRMVQANRRLCEILQRAIPVVHMYQHPTVRSLALSLAPPSPASASAPSATQSGRERAALRRELLARRQPTNRQASS